MLQRIKRAGRMKKLSTNKIRMEANEKNPPNDIIFAKIIMLCALVLIVSGFYLMTNYPHELRSKLDLFQRYRSMSIDTIVPVAQSFSKVSYYDKINDINFTNNLSNILSEQVLSDSLPKRRRIAFAITITKDGNFQDGAAVLAYSIIKAMRDSEYDISFVAFVHPTVSSSRPVLSRLGYHIIEAPTPINVSAIPFTFLREKINKNGCCGASELIKLNSYRLLGYDRVVHLDADTFLLQPIDELLTRNYSLIYTTDPNMATHKGEKRMPVQGGFLILKPDEQDFRNVIDIIMTTEFRMGSAWNGSKIGWFWGGMTVQGVLPYYYNAVTSPGRSQIVDRCIYNTMADVDECIAKSVSEVKSAHFTVCQKPWGCWKSYYNILCQELHTRWFSLRREAEEFFGVEINNNPCPRGGHEHYQPMKLSRAHLPTEISFVVHDDSPDLLEPTEESRYLTKNYDNYVGGKFADSDKNIQKKTKSKTNAV